MFRVLRAVLLQIVCVALHPGGELVATGQGATAGGAAARLSVWDVNTLREVSRVGRVLDEKKNDGVTTRPFYPGSLCAAAFGPDGRLLIGVGKDDQHLVGVWNWSTGELLAKAPGLVARPLGVHQIAVAPTPVSVDAQGRKTLFFTLVGVTNAPKFGTIGPVAAPGPTRWELTFTVGKLGLPPGKPPPPSMSAVAYGGASFPSPSGAKHGLTFVGGGFGGIYIFDAPANTVALRVVPAHSGPISVLCPAGGALATGGEDGFVHLWAAADGVGLQKIHTYSFTAVDAGKNPGARPASAGTSNPNSVVRMPPRAKTEKPPEPVSSTKPAGAMPTTGNNGVGAIRALTVLPLGAKRAVATNRQVQIVCCHHCRTRSLQPQLINDCARLRSCTAYIAGRHGSMCHLASRTSRRQATRTRALWAGDRCGCAPDRWRCVCELWRGSAADPVARQRAFAHALCAIGEACEMRGICSGRWPGGCWLR